MADSQDDQVECPLCMEPLEVDDLTFFPCSCGYQICRFCWHRIRTDENELCPACRKAYSENPADFKPLSQEQVAALKAEKRQRDQQKKQKVNEDRKHLANVRVVQKNLVFVVGLPPRLADPEVLKRHEYFGKYGKIHKVVINPSTAYAGAQGPSASAYVTYVSNNDALKAIQSVNNITIDNRLIKTSLGTTKYCSNFMKNQPCPKPDCMYLHELGDEEASFTKEEMHQGKHQEYEKKLHDTLMSQTAQEDREQRERERETAAETKNTTTTTNNTNTNNNNANNNNSNNSSSSSSTTNGKPERSSSQNGDGPTKREKREKRENSSNGGGSSKRNKDTWPSLTTSPVPKSKPVKENGKVDSKGKSESSKGSRSGDREREKKSSPVTTTTIVEEKEPASSESSNDSSYQKEKLEETETTPSLPEAVETEITTKLQPDIESFFENNSDSSNSADGFAALSSSEQTIKGRINSQLPDLLNGTEIDRPGYGFSAFGMFDQTAFGKHNGDGFDDFFQPLHKLKLDDSMQRCDESSLLEKSFCDQKMEAKNNCSSNMLKFFDFHKNLQNQKYYQQSPGFPMAQEKSYSIFTDYSKPADVEVKQQRIAPPVTNSFPHPEQHFPPALANNTNKHNNILNSMYQMSSIQPPSVADDLGFDPFTETQKALEELIKDETNRKNGEMAAKRNSLNAPPGFSQINNTPGPRNLVKQPGWNSFNGHQQQQQPQQQHQNQNMMGGMNGKPSGLGNAGDWTTFDPAIVSYRQFSSQHNNYGGSNGMDHMDPRGMMGMPNAGPNMNDFHFNLHPQQQQQQQPNLNFPFDTNGSYGLFASHARNSLGNNSNANNWFNHPSPGYQNTASSLEKIMISMPPGFPANMNGNRNN